MKELVTITLKNVPVNVRQEFKALCAKERINMQDKIIELMTNELADVDLGNQK